MLIVAMLAFFGLFLLSACDLGQLNQENNVHSSGVTGLMKVFYTVLYCQVLCSCAVDWAVLYSIVLNYKIQQPTCLYCTVLY